jgi:Bacterial Ig-like domain (group 3)
LVSGQPATITATVSDTTHTSTTATGSVTFTDTAGTTITSLNNGSAVSLSGGTARLTGVVLNGINTHTITAHYAGVSGTFLASTNTATATLSKASVTVAGLQQPIPGAWPVHRDDLPAPITLSVSGLPPGATATISPNTLPAGSSLTNVTLTVQIPQVTAGLDQKQPPGRQISLALWGFLLLPFAGKLRRAGRRLTKSASLLILLAAGVAAAAGLSSCGSSNGFFGHPQQAYTLTITATSGSVSHSTTVTLTVE